MARLDKKNLRYYAAGQGRFADTPLALTTRWVPRRKALVVAAVNSGDLSLQEACHRYALTIEEFRSWQRALDKDGLAGLRATHALEYRVGNPSAERHVDGRHGVERGRVEQRHA